MKKKRNPALIFFLVTAIICVLLLVTAIILWCVGSPDDGMETAATIIVIIGGVGLGFDLIAYLVYCMFAPSKVEAREEIQRESEEIRRASIERQEKEREFELWKLQNIKKTVIINVSAKKDKGNATTRGVVGGLLFGVAGAVVGATTGREHVFTTFLVIYTDDSREVMEVENGSELYNLYLQHLEA